MKKIFLVIVVVLSIFCIVSCKEQVDDEFVEELEYSNFFQGEEFGILDEHLCERLNADRVFTIIDYSPNEYKRAGKFRLEVYTREKDGWYQQFFYSTDSFVKDDEVILQEVDKIIKLDNISK